VKTLDFVVRLRHDPDVPPVSRLRHVARADDVRARAEAAADAGSPAAALALMATAAEDVERDAPLSAAVLWAEGSWYALLAHGAERALQLAQHAAELANGATGDVALIVHARLGDALQWNGRYADARRSWIEAAAAPTPTDPRLLCTRADALLRADDLVRARECAYAAAARAEEAGDRPSIRDALTFQAHAEIHLGLLREAHASALRLEAGARTGMNGDRMEAIGILAWIEALLGDESSCRARLADAAAGAVELGFTLYGGMAAGLLELALGRYDAAVDHLEAKLDGTSPLAATLSLRPFLDALVEACVRAGRRDRATALVDEVFAPAVATDRPRYAALAFRMRALATDELEDFATALEHHAAWRNRFEEGRTRLLLGEVLRRAKRRSEARAELSWARAAFDAVGAQLWARRAEDELRAAGARPARPASGAALTAQEERIAGLVADGLSNKEIAARLVVSTKTVEGHLRNLFEKLGVTSRTQVARALPPAG
jgi:DNA-binding CsgD family transcriptional regulator